MAEFNWHLGDPPPLIESHSQAKLNYLASYLAAYFDTLNIHLGAKKFKLDLVDGFCGGGLFQSDSGEVAESPLQWAKTPVLYTSENTIRERRK